MKSTGPRTEAGKARSSLNALKHTAYSNKALLYIEDSGEFQSILAAYTSHWQPQTQPEMDLVRDIAIARWRLDRTVAVESATIGLEMVRTEEYAQEQYNNLRELDYLAYALTHLADRSRVLALLSRQENSLRRTIARASAELRRMREQKVSRNNPGDVELPRNQSVAGNVDPTAVLRAA